MIIKKSTLWMGLIFIVLAAVGFFLNSAGSIGNGIRETAVNTVVVSADDVQVVKMHVEGAQYVLEPSSVKKGVPVRLEADISRMPGCSKSVISSELNIRKTFNSGSNTLEFTPDKAGTFYLACSMNMYKGALTILELDGSKSSYVQTATPSGATCGAGGQGCGCGG